MSSLPDKSEELRKKYGVRHQQAFLLCCCLATCFLHQVTILRWNSHTTPAICSERELSYPFYLALTVSHFVGGYLCTKLDNKYLLLFSSLVGSVCSYLFPVIRKKQLCVLLHVVQVLSGATQGLVVPTVYAQISCWIPPLELPYIATLALAGRNWGRLLSFSFQSNMMTSGGGWESVFLFAGNIGLIWCFSYAVYGASNPHECWYISSDEKNYIVSKLSLRSRGTYRKRVPWKGIIRNVPTYAIVLVITGDFYVFRKISIISPQVLKEKFDSDISVVAYFASFGFFTYIFILLTWIFITKQLIKRNLMNLKHVRYTANSIAQYGFGVCLLLLSNSKYFPEFIIYHFCGFFVHSLLLLGAVSNPFDLTPNYVSALAGWTNGVAWALIMMIEGVTYAIKENLELHESWEVEYLACGLLLLFCNFVFTTCGSTKVQQYDSYHDQEEGNMN